LSAIRTVREIWTFLRVRKKLWLLPMIAVFLLFGLLLAAGQSSVGVFVYTLF
jgi:hypothetical protein